MTCKLDRLEPHDPKRHRSEFAAWKFKGCVNWTKPQVGRFLPYKPKQISRTTIFLKYARSASRHCRTRSAPNASLAATPIFPIPVPASRITLTHKEATKRR